jgi:ribonuclease HI
MNLNNIDGGRVEMSVKSFLDKYFKTDKTQSATVTPVIEPVLEPTVGTMTRSQLDYYKPRETKQEFQTLHLFTDGACSDNGKKNAKGGYGVHVYGKPEHDVSMKLLADEQQTNNRGELRAIQAALDLLDRFNSEWSHTYSEFYIWSDSEYSINCLTKWAKGWRANNWKKRDGGIIINLDLIKSLYERLSRMTRVSLHHVRAHQDSKRNEFPYDGNIRADKLATQSLR